MTRDEDPQVANALRELVHLLVKEAVDDGQPVTINTWMQCYWCERILLGVLPRGMSALLLVGPTPVMDDADAALQTAVEVMRRTWHA